MKTLLIVSLVIIICLSIIIIYQAKKMNVYGNMYNRDTLNMANTVDPIITMISQKLGDYENIQESTPALGGKLIYKREPCNNCISKIMNNYYIRTYEWGYEDDKLWYKPIKDIPIGAHSCIPEKDVSIPYWDKEFQYAVLGEKYYPEKE